MRTHLLLALATALLIPVAAPASETIALPIDTVVGTYLFSLGDTSFVQCQAALGVHDSAAAAGLGTCIGGQPPIWKFLQTTFAHSSAQGDTVWIERYILPRRAGTVEVGCTPEVFDPLTIDHSSSYAAASLFHRAIFQYDSSGQVIGDLATDWWWRGSDLMIVIDTTRRFTDGSVIDAAAVKYSIERHFWYRRNVPAYSWHYSIAGVKNYLNGFARSVVGLIPRSRDTLQINLIRPLYELPAYFTATRLSVVKWQVTGDRAPVVATAGYYGPAEGNAAPGRSSHGGTLVLNNSSSSGDVLNFGSGLAGHVTYISNVAVPGMLVLRAATGLNSSIMTFVDFALDRWVVGEVSTGKNQLSPSGIYPVCLPCEAWSESKVKDALRSRMWQANDTVALADARAARRLFKGFPRVRVAYADGWAKTAEYFVDWLKAWDVRGELTADSSRWDVRIEYWDYDGFSRDTWAETALWKLGLRATDTLVQRLIQARGIRDDVMRSLAYKSLLSRIEESAQYIVLYQELTGYSYSDVEPVVDVTVDIYGRPRGPLFTGPSDP